MLGELIMGAADAAIGAVSGPILVAASRKAVLEKDSIKDEAAKILEAEGEEAVDKYLTKKEEEATMTAVAAMAIFSTAVGFTSSFIANNINNMVEGDYTPIETSDTDATPIEDNGGDDATGEF